MENIFLSLLKSLVENIVGTFVPANSAYEFFDHAVVIIKRISFVSSVLFSLGIVFVLFKLAAFRPKFDLSVEGKPDDSTEKMREKWIAIMKRLDPGTEADAKLAIIEADNFVDDILKRSGFSGETMADRMEKINSSEVPALNGLWDAHRVRNNIAHSPGFKITMPEALAIMKKYEKFLEEFGVF